MKARRVVELLQLPVRTEGSEVARAVEALVAEGGALLGFEVRRRDGELGFLPLAAADVREDEIAVPSELVLLPERDLAYYRERARPLGDLGLAEPVLTEDGTVAEAVAAGRPC